MMTAEAHQHDAFERAAESLDWIESMRGWDTEGAPGFPPALAAEAGSLIEGLPRVPLITSTGRESPRLGHR